MYKFKSRIILALFAIGFTATQCAKDPGTDTTINPPPVDPVDINQNGLPRGGYVKVYDATKPQPVDYKEVDCFDWTGRTFTTKIAVGDGTITVWGITLGPTMISFSEVFPTLGKVTHIVSPTTNSAYIVEESVDGNQRRLSRIDISLTAVVTFTSNVIGEQSLLASETCDYTFMSLRSDFGGEYSYWMGNYPVGGQAGSVASLILSHQVLSTLPHGHTALAVSGEYLLTKEGTASFLLQGNGDQAIGTILSSDKMPLNVVEAMEVSGDYPAIVTRSSNGFLAISEKGFTGFMAIYQFFSFGTIVRFCGSGVVEASDGRYYLLQTPK